MLKIAENNLGKALVTFGFNANAFNWLPCRTHIVAERGWTHKVSTTIAGMYVSNLVIRRYCAESVSPIPCHGLEESDKCQGHCIWSQIH